MKKRNILSILAALLAAVLLLTGCPKSTSGTDGTGGGSGQTQTPDADLCEQFDALLDDLFLNEISLDTITLHFTVQDPAKYGLENMEPRWEAPEGADRYPLETLKAELAKYDPDKLTDDRRLTYEILQYQCRWMEKMSDEKFQYFSTNLDMNNGIHVAIPVNLAEYEFYREKDVTDFLALIDGLPEYMQTVIDWEKERVEAGYGVSDAVLDSIIERCDEILSDENFYLIDIFAERVDEADFLTDAQKADYKAKEKSLIEGDFMASFKALRDALDTFKGRGLNGKGLVGYPNGAEYYVAYADYLTGTEYTGEGLIKLLEDDYSSLMGQLMGVVMSNPGVYESFAENPAPIAETDPAKILDAVRPKMSKLFPDISGDSYEIRYLPKSMEKVMDGVLAYYTIPQVDNFLKGRITINGGAGDLSGFYNTVTHEGYPGHMYQNIYFYSTNAHNLRKVLTCTGYSEGWAYYAASLAYSLYDFAEGSAMANLCRLNDNLNWNLQCRVDLGINYEGWTVEQLAAYLEENGLDSSAAGEIYDTIIGVPCAYLPYYIGYLEFNRLQKQASSELGNAYIPVEFHKAVLDVGSVPFTFVKEAVDAYIASKK